MATDNLNKWINGIPYELAFWNNVMRWKRGFDGLMGWSRYGKEIKLENFDVQSFLASRGDAVVLDVGSGMSFSPGDHLMLPDGTLKKLDIRYIDPLAEYYNDIKRRHHRNIPDVEFGMLEYLSAFYPKGADLIHIQNALDHSSRPLKGIYEAIECLKIGGILYLNHHPNEAEAERYKGFHQYNIINENETLVLWNKSEKHILNELIKEFADIEVSRADNGHVIAIITKRAELPEKLLTTNKDRNDLATLLMEQNKIHNSLVSSISYIAQYWKYNSIHFIVQGLPWEWRMKMKEILKR